jgi:hypothetical protein
MPYTVAENARPQLKLLVAAVAVSIAVWAFSWVVPAMAYVLYPLQLFATFIHEGSHVLATLITGNSVHSMTISPDASGVVWSQSSGLSTLLISSAGYLGTTAFGIILLAWMRHNFSSRVALYFMSLLIASFTMVFGLVSPVWNFFENVTFFSVVFTVIAGAALSIGLAAVARFASKRWVDFALGFIAVSACSTLSSASKTCS